MKIGRFARPLIRDALDALETVFKKTVRGALDGPRNVGVGRPTIGRIIFEAAILGRVMRWRDHHAVGKAIGAAPVGGEDRMRVHRRRRMAGMPAGHPPPPVAPNPPTHPTRPPRRPALRL